MPGALDLVGEAVGRLRTAGPHRSRYGRGRRAGAGTAGTVGRPGAQLAGLCRRTGVQPGAPARSGGTAGADPRPQTQIRRHHRTDHGVRRNTRRPNWMNLGNWEVKTAELEKQEEDLLLPDRPHGRRTERTTPSSRRTDGAPGRDRIGRPAHGARARFGVAVTQTPASDGAYLPDGRRVAFDSTGVDQVEFLISANPGEPLKPMAKVASGGETARLMLALKSVLTHADATPTLIFDEIDQGIGGHVSAPWSAKNCGCSPGDNLADNGRRSTSHQVLCITHLPQLAAFRRPHFTVNKQVLEVQRRGAHQHRRARSGRARRASTNWRPMLGAVSEAGRRVGRRDGGRSREGEKTGM